MSQGDKTSSRYVVINENSSGAVEAAGLTDPQHDGAVERTGNGAERNPEAVRRVEVADEDRMAFRVGVNLLVLLIIGVGGYLLWRNFFG